MGFDNLSHIKPVMERNQRPLIKLRYPTYDDTIKKIMKFSMKNINFTQYKLVKVLCFLVLFMSLAYFRNGLMNGLVRLQLVL